MAKFTCERGHFLHGEQVLQCRETGQWSATPPLCLQNGTRVSLHVWYRKLAMYIVRRTLYAFSRYTYSYLTMLFLKCTLLVSCWYIASLQHTSGMYCSLSSALDTPCNNPNVPANLDVPAGPYYAGSVITLSCQNGFQATGDLSMTCQSDGEWSRLKGTCQSKQQV